MNVASAPFWCEIISSMPLLPPVVQTVFQWESVVGRLNERKGKASAPRAPLASATLLVDQLIVPLFRFLHSANANEHALN